MVREQLAGRLEGYAVAETQSTIAWPLLGEVELLTAARACGPTGEFVEAVDKS